MRYAISARSKLTASKLHLVRNRGAYSPHSDLWTHWCLLGNYSEIPNGRADLLLRQLYPLANVNVSVFETNYPYCWRPAPLLTGMSNRRPDMLMATAGPPARVRQLLAMAERLLGGDSCRPLPPPAACLWHRQTCCMASHPARDSGRRFAPPALAALPSGIRRIESINCGSCFWKAHGSPAEFYTCQSSQPVPGREAYPLRRSSIENLENRMEVILPRPKTSEIFVPAVTTRHFLHKGLSHWRYSVQTPRGALQSLVAGAHNVFQNTEAHPIDCRLSRLLPLAPGQPKASQIDLVEVLGLDWKPK
uniref:Uncharacterized protein n=1 Tax=Macrostomum lignano TaxID=282301 RepID=A0A1I8FKT6_9PLAT